MSKPNDGGPAFPLASKGWIGKSFEDLKPTEIVRHGMSLRAHLAGRAMQGLVAGITKLGTGPHEDNIIQNRPKDVSELAVLYADTLIAELEKEVEEPREFKVRTPLPKVRWTPLNRFMADAGTPLKTEPKFKVGNRVRVKKVTPDRYSGAEGVVKCVPYGHWDYGVRLDKRSATGLYGFSEKELEAVESEKPAPKFKKDEPVWVKKGVGPNFAEKVALVSESKCESSGKWAYKVWIPLGGGPGREYAWYYEHSLEAIDWRGE